jgi:hypothetical protein
VGYTGGPLFTEGALTLIAEAGQGTPRIINNLCFNALALCCALKSKEVSEKMVSEVLADMDLNPPAKEPIAPVEPLEVRQTSVTQVRKLTVRLQNPWIPAAAALLVTFVLGIFGFAALRNSQSIKSRDDNTLNSKALPTSSSSQAMADAAEGSVPDVTSKTEPIEITVEPEQRLELIAEQYLGGYDLHRLRQIQELNPKLTNPNHIETGQKLRLPPPVQVAAERVPASASNARRLQ